MYVFAWKVVTEQEGETEREKSLFHLPVLSPNGCNGQAWAGAKPEDSLGSPTWEAGAHILGPSSTVLSCILSGIWLRDETSRTQTSTCMGYLITGAKMLAPSSDSREKLFFASAEVRIQRWLAVWCHFFASYWDAGSCTTNAFCFMNTYVYTIDCNIVMKMVLSYWPPGRAPGNQGHQHITLWE